MTLGWPSVTTIDEIRKRHERTEEEYGRNLLSEHVLHQDRGVLLELLDEMGKADFGENYLAMKLALTTTSEMLNKAEAKISELESGYEITASDLEKAETKTAELVEQVKNLQASLSNVCGEIVRLRERQGGGE